MREVTILIWCDFCWHREEQQSPAVSKWTVGINEGDRGHPAVRLVELCERHTQEMKALHEAWSEITQLPTPDRHRPEQQAQKVGKALAADASASEASPGPKRRVCPVCRHRVASSTLVGHIWSVHRKYEVKPPIPKECPDCGHPTPSPQGHMAHRRSAHGHDAVAEALAGIPGLKPLPVDDDEDEEAG